MENTQEEQVFRPLHMEEPKSKVKIVNTNLETYRDTMHGIEYAFEPLVIYEVDAEKGRWAVGRAKAAWANMKAQARDERQMWARLIDAPSQLARDQAPYYCDKDGNPRTKPMIRPGLVEYDSEEGQKMYQAALREVARGDKIVTEKAPEEPVEKNLGDGELTVEVDKPSKTWDIEQLYGYCERRGVAVTNLDKSPKKKEVLLNKALKGFNDHIKVLEERGVKFVVKEE